MAVIGYGSTMKELKTLRVGANLYNNPSNGYIIVDFQPWDGGPFGLMPRETDTGLVLVDPKRPAGYGLEIIGDPDTLEAAAKALLKIARAARGPHLTPVPDPA